VILALGLSVVGRSINEVARLKEYRNRQRLSLPARLVWKEQWQKVLFIHSSGLVPTTHPDYAVSPTYQVSGQTKPALGDNYIYTPQIDKNSFAQIWLGDPDNNVNNSIPIPKAVYTLDNFM